MEQLVRIHWYMLHENQPDQVFLWISEEIRGGTSVPKKRALADWRFFPWNFELQTTDQPPSLLRKELSLT